MEPGRSWSILASPAVASFPPVFCSSNWGVGAGVRGSSWMMGGEEGPCLSSGKSFLALPHQQRRPAWGGQSRDSKTVVKDIS